MAALLHGYAVLSKTRGSQWLLLLETFSSRLCRVLLWLGFVLCEFCVIVASGHQPCFFVPSMRMHLTADRMTHVDLWPPGYTVCQAWRLVRAMHIR